MEDIYDEIYNMDKGCDIEELDYWRHPNFTFDRDNTCFGNLGLELEDDEVIVQFSIVCNQNSISIIDEDVLRDLCDKDFDIYNGDGFVVLYKTYTIDEDNITEEVMDEIEYLMRYTYYDDTCYLEW